MSESEDTPLIHYNDIKEYGVYQPVVDGVDLSHLKLVCLTYGVTTDSVGNKIPDHDHGRSRFLVSENYRWVLSSEGSVASQVGYVNITYRKLEHIEPFVGLRLKE